MTNSATTFGFSGMFSIGFEFLTGSRRALGLAQKGVVIEALDQLETAPEWIMTYLTRAKTA